MEVPEGHILITKGEYDGLHGTISDLKEIVLRLESRIKELEGQLDKNSSNSHKPPSSDGLKRTIKNSRVKSERKAGGQQGHKGSTLEMVENPDKIVEHKVTTCTHCGIDLEQIEVKRRHRRQVWDIPPVKVEITEHQVEVKLCPVCGKHTVAPCEARAAVQYGEAVKSMAVYLNQYQMLPVDRVSETMSDLFNCPLSAEVIQQSNNFAYQQLEQTVENNIKKALIESQVLHADETGIRCEGKTKWIHTYSSQGFTYYAMHHKRGKEAMDYINILPHFKGKGVHDRLKSYDQYENFKHGYCNAHLLRDLESVKEDDHRVWAEQMQKLTLDAHLLSKRDLINEQVIAIIEKQYDQIVEEGIKQEPLPVNIPGKRGRKAKGKSLNLLECYQKRKKSILLFLHDPNVPFDNNLAERDLRMVKLKQKISGCFRTRTGADTFCRIRSYVSTIKKQNGKVWDALKTIMSRSPSIQPVFI